MFENLLYHPFMREQAFYLLDPFIKVALAQASLLQSIDHGSGKKLLKAPCPGIPWP